MSDRTVFSAFLCSGNSIMKENDFFERFEQLCKFVRKFLYICGADILKKNYKVNWRTISVYMLLNCSIFVSLYTMYIDSVVNGDVYNAFKTLSVLGSGIQGYVKLTTYVTRTKEIRFLYEEIKDMYLTFEKQSQAYVRCLDNNLSLVQKMLSSYFWMVIVLLHFFLGLPFYILLVKKQRVDFLPYKLPYLDTETDFGYYTTSCSQIVCVFFAVWGNFTSDSWLFIYVGHIPLMKNILKCKFDELNDLSETEAKSATTSNEVLKDIFKWHQKYNLFTKTIRSAFFWIIFFQIGTEFVGIACSVVCIFLGIWPVAPAITIYLFAMIYSYCALGNLVELANDEVTDMIYDCKWYNLTTMDQKLILIMLRDSQQATGITIGGVAPLSLNTALQLTKTIYTFSMILKESFE